MANSREVEGHAKEVGNGKVEGNLTQSDLGVAEGAYKSLREEDICLYGKDCTRIKKLPLQEKSGL